MLIRYGYELTFVCAQPTFMLCRLDAHPDHAQDLRFEAPLVTTPQIPATKSIDTHGNEVRSFVAPAGRLTIWRDSILETSGLPDRADPTAMEVSLAELPIEISCFLIGSRYCETDKLADVAWELFGSIPRGWQRVRAICDFVHRHLKFGYQYARATRTAFEAYEERVGVCRDFAHLAVTFCRCMNIPARYANGFLGEIGVPVTGAPRDYNAWFEAYLDGGWFTFDPRHNIPRVGRILVARGRDAADIPLVMSFGSHKLETFRVWTDEVHASVLDDLTRRSA